MTDFATYCPECGTGDPGEDYCASCGERLLAVVVSVFGEGPKRAISWKSKAMTDDNKRGRE